MSLYAKLYANLLLAPGSYLRGRKYDSRFRFLLRSQWWSRDELQSFQWTELSKLIRVAASSTPYYQELFRRIGLEPGDVRNWDDFRRIPVLKREDVAQNKERLASTTMPRSGLLPMPRGDHPASPSGFPGHGRATIGERPAREERTGWAGYAPGEKSLTSGAHP